MAFPLSNFEEYVSKKILDRGRSYYHYDAILEFKGNTDGWYEALVEGSDEYEVGVYVEKGKIARCSCDCPYSYGPICKHMVAVFYRIRDEQKDSMYDSTFGKSGINSNKPKATKKKATKKAAPTTRKTTQKSSTPTDPIHQLFVKLPAGELEKWIFQKFRVNPSLKNQFLNDFAHLSPQESLDYEAMVASILQKRHLPSIVDELTQLIDGKARQLSAQNATEAFALAKAILPHSLALYNETNELDWEIEVLNANAFELLHSINDNDFSEELQAEIYQYAYQQSQSEVAKEWDFEQGFVQVAIATATTLEELNPLYDYMENLLDQHLSAHFQKQWGRIFNIAKTRKQAFINQQEKAKAREEKPFVPKKKTYQFKNAPVEKAFKKKQYDKVMALALIGLEEAEKGGYEDLLQDCQVWMLKVAQATNNITDIITWSVSLFIDTGDIGYYHLFKKHSPSTDNWHKKSSRLIQQLIATQEEFPLHSIAAIYIEEEQFEDLLKLVKEHPSEANIILYGKYLEERFKGEWEKLKG